ncbi:hypothetical protein LIER_41333 [Lithospermum erythrorhizon]|uniref:Cystatin domain-containing protein n=1 Tax=Lithospermum erythrorhizon TaxID=34254 RepID=A0AAV3RDJ3_LITER
MPRLMPQKRGANKIVSKQREENHNLAEDEKSGKRSKMPPRKLLAQCGAPEELDLDEFHPPEFFDHLKDCATLAIQDHCIINFQDWRDWRVVKIDKALKIRVCGFVYHLTFQAQNGGGRVHTFEAHVWQNTCFRRVNRVRTVSPFTTIW